MDVVTRGSRLQRLRRGAMGWKPIPLLLVLVFSFAIGLGGNAAIADEISDARVILDAGSGQVRKWTTVPRISVLYEGDFNKSELSKVLDKLSNATMMNLNSHEVRYIDLAARLSEMSRGSSFHITDPSFKYYDKGVLKLGGAQALESDIFVFNVNPMTAAYLAIVTGSVTGTDRLARQFAEGRVDCYYDALSRDNKIEISFILISSLIDDETRSACIDEEITQSLGLFNDAESSTYFTFNNSFIEPKRNYDMKLLSSLYDSRIREGAEVDEVLKILSEKIEGSID